MWKLRSAFFKVEKKSERKKSIRKSAHSRHTHTAYRYTPQDKTFVNLTLSSNLKKSDGTHVYAVIFYFANKMCYCQWTDKKVSKQKKNEEMLQSKNDYGVLHVTCFFFFHLDMYIINCCGSRFSFDIAYSPFDFPIETFYFLKSRFLYYYLCIRVKCGKGKYCWFKLKHFFVCFFFSSAFFIWNP